MEHIIELDRSRITHRPKNKQHPWEYIIRDCAGKKFAGYGRSAQDAFWSCFQQYTRFLKRQGMTGHDWGTP